MVALLSADCSAAIFIADRVLFISGTFLFLLLAAVQWYRFAHLHYRRNLAHYQRAHNSRPWIRAAGQRSYSPPVSRSQSPVQNARSLHTIQLNHQNKANVQLFNVQSAINSSPTPIVATAGPPLTTPSFALIDSPKSHIDAANVPSAGTQCHIEIEISSSYKDNGNDDDKQHTQTHPHTDEPYLYVQQPLQCHVATATSEMTVKNEKNEMKVMNETQGAELHLQVSEESNNEVHMKIVHDRLAVTASLPALASSASVKHAFVHPLSPAHTTNTVVAAVSTISISTDGVEMPFSRWLSLWLNAYMCLFSWSALTGQVHVRMMISSLQQFAVLTEVLTALSFIPRVLSTNTMQNDYGCEQTLLAMLLLTIGELIRSLLVLGLIVLGSYTAIYNLYISIQLKAPPPWTLWLHYLVISTLITVYLSSLIVRIVTNIDWPKALSELMAALLLDIAGVCVVYTYCRVRAVFEASNPSQNLAEGAENAGVIILRRFRLIIVALIVGGLLICQPILLYLCAIAISDYQQPFVDSSSPMPIDAIGYIQFIAMASILYAFWLSPTTDEEVDNILREHSVNRSRM